MMSRRTVLTALASATLIPAPIAHAADGPGDGKPKMLLFNIPAQSLQSALIAYAAVAGTQILYDTRAAQRRHAHAVVGLFTADTALRLLISGTDLTILASGGDSVLVPIAELRERGGFAGNGSGGATLVLDTLYVDVAPGTQQRRDYSDYGARVRGQLLHAITTNPRTSKRIYRLRLGITIDPRGAIDIARLTDSSGTAAVITSLQQVIRQVIVDRPPPDGMPQPIYLTIIGV